MSTRDNQLTPAQIAIAGDMQLAKAAVNDAANDGEIVIKYRPHAGLEKWVEYRFSAWSTGKAWLAMAMVTIFFALGGPGHIVEGVNMWLTGAGSTALVAGGAGAVSQTVNYWAYTMMFWLFGLLGLGTLGAYVIYPTDVRFNRDGVQLEWNRFRQRFRRSLAWDNMESIELFYPPGKTSQQDLVLRFKAADTAGGDLNSLNLKFGAVATIDEREKLHRAIDRWAGDIGKDVQLIEMLKPAQDHSYTELWMQALSAPPKRERLTPLPYNAGLQAGRFVILEQLGVGGQGTAYLTRDTETNNIVVLKEFILPVYVDLNVRRQALERMQNEAAMLRRLDNPRIVQLLDFFIEDHRGYLVLECIDGFSLRKIVDDQGKMEETRVRELALQMCEMLKYLHNLTPPVVHRDFTPDNLILGSDGVLKLVDFNVAQQTESTATGTVVGKHAYLPPEQFRGRPVPQSDIYAMGATLYFLLLGEDPEPITCVHPILKDDKISAELDGMVARATALDLKKRYQKIEEFAQDLSPAKEAVEA